MKQKLLLKKVLLQLAVVIFIGVISAPITQAADNSNMLVIGDSIGVGLSRMLNPGKSSSVGSAQVSAIAGFDGTGNFTRMVISAGSNGPRNPNNAANLRIIRNKQPNARTVWVLPYNADAKATVRSVASSFGDLTIDLSNYPAVETPPAAPVHPRDYRKVATDIEALFGNSGGGTGIPAQNQPATSANITPLTETPIQGGGGGGLIPCGRKAGQGALSEPCTACHAVLAGKNLIDYLTGIMVVVAIAVIVGMGVLYIMSGVNANLKKTAKAGLTAVLVGLVLMLSAWLIVSTILRFLASPAFIQGGDGFIGLGAGQGVFGLQCNTTSFGGTAVLTAGGRMIPGGGSQGVNGGGGSGTCSPITGTSNPCSVESLRNTCFVSSAETWSRMCNLESRGTPIRSQTDVCVNLGGRSFSGGLFQINILANGRILDPQRCDDLGSHGTASSNCVRRNASGVCTGWNCTQGSDYANWDYCMGLTMNAQTNIQAACQLSRQGHVTTPWPHTRRVCGVAERI